MSKDDFYSCFVEFPIETGTSGAEATRENLLLSRREFMMATAAVAGCPFATQPVRASEFTPVAQAQAGIDVTTKDLVMKVFMDAETNYSVSGYADRARHCWGGFYLCLDSGAEYDRQSAKVNEALGKITAPEAFGLSLQETRKALADGPADDLAIAGKTLTSLCTHWFDLPDAVNVGVGGLRLRAVPPPQCPGDFIWPSGYLFFPDPGADLVSKGQAFGEILQQAGLRYVAGLRLAGKRPKGALSRAAFEAFPHGEDELVAKTIVGLMVGMIPTLIINLYYVLAAWRTPSETRFAALQSALNRHDGVDPYLRANDVLMQPLMQAMQDNPMPDAVWRTAVKEHMLGSVQVNPGDKINVQIKSAMREDQQGGVLDVFPMFGGDRSAAPHGTHACPAYEMTFGIMLGVIYGLMEQA